MWSISSVSAVVPYVVGLREVAGDALADRLRLADVDDAPAGVAEEVDARLVREGAALLFEPLPALLLEWCFDGHGALTDELRRGPGPQLGAKSSVPGPMYRMRTTIVLAALAALVLAVPASANYRVGISEQDARTFDQPLWQGLKLKRVRYIVPWDFYKGDGQAEATHLHERRAREEPGRPRDVHGPPRLLLQRQVLEVERLPRAVEGRVHDRLQEVQGGVPVGEVLRAVERGQPRLPADGEEPEARRRLLRRHARQLQGLQDPRRRRARPEHRDDLAAQLHQVLQEQGPRSGACTTTRTSTASSPRA